MSNGFASALEISARYIRDNDAITARRLITERLHTAEQSEDTEGRENNYLLNMHEGFRAALAGLYAIAQRGQMTIATLPPSNHLKALRVFIERIQYTRTVPSYQEFQQAEDSLRKRLSEVSRRIQSVR